MKRKVRGQSAVIDGLVLMLVLSGAVTLLVMVSGLYAASSRGQVLGAYSYEYAGNALVALHYAKNDSSGLFWTGLQQARQNGDKETATQEYLSNNPGLLQKILDSSPAPVNLLCFSPPGSGGFTDCYDLTNGGNSVTSSDLSRPCGQGSDAYSYETYLGSDEKVSLVLCY